MTHRERGPGGNSTARTRQLSAATQASVRTAFQTFHVVSNAARPVPPASALFSGTLIATVTPNATTCSASAAMPHPEARRGPPRLTVITEMAVSSGAPRKPTMNHGLTIAALICRMDRTKVGSSTFAKPGMTAQEKA